MLSGWIEKYEPVLSKSYSSCDYSFCVRLIIVLLALNIGKQHSTTTCFDSYNYLCFKIIDKANSKFDLKIKEALHINWRKPNLNAQQNHLALTLSL